MPFWIKEKKIWMLDFIFPFLYSLKVETCFVFCCLTKSHDGYIEAKLGFSL